MMKISELRLDRKVVAAFILVVGSYLAFTHNERQAIAATNASGLTGQYGCMMNRNGSGYATLWQGQNGISTGLIIYLDYSNNTAKGLLTMANDYNLSSVTTSTEKISTTFIEEEVGGVTKTYKTVHTVTNSDGSPGGVATFIGITVNSGNTILMTQVEEQRAKATWSGVCQKI